MSNHHRNVGIDEKRIAKAKWSTVREYSKWRREELRGEAREVDKSSREAPKE